MAERSATGENDDVGPQFHHCFGDLPAHDFFEFPQFSRETHSKVLVRELSDFIRRQQFTQPVERKHDVGIFGAWGGVEVSRYKADVFCISIVWNQTETQVIVAERLHALDVRSRRGYEGNAA